MMQGLRIYLAGPMESVGGNWNMPLFDFVAKKLREAGAEVFSPVHQMREMFGSQEAVLKLDEEGRRPARKAGLRADFLWIIDNANMVLLLPGWERSPGATAERAVALSIGIDVRETGNVILPAGAGREPDIDFKPILDAPPE